jgi:hypothetical protein
MVVLSPRVRGAKCNGLSLNSALFVDPRAFDLPRWLCGGGGGGSVAPRFAVIAADSFSHRDFLFAPRPRDFGTGFMDRRVSSRICKLIFGQTNRKA